MGSPKRRIADKSSRSCDSPPGFGRGSLPDDGWRFGRLTGEGILGCTARVAVPAAFTWRFIRARENLDSGLDPGAADQIIMFRREEFLSPVSTSLIRPGDKGRPVTVYAAAKIRQIRFVEGNPQEF